jgi:hypothetical protein
MKKAIGVILFFVLLGCGRSPYIEENSAFIVFKTPTFRYADMGFVYQNANEVKLQIYSNAQSVMSLKVTQSSVCMSMFECMSPSSFNAKVLSDKYPPSILRDILRAKPIMDKKYIKYTQDGFIQDINVANSYNIKYKVSKNKIEFVDKLNHINIKIIKDI